MTMLTPQLRIKQLQMDDPTFGAGESKTARARLTNPTAKSFTYTVELYLGVARAATSGVATVTIPAGGYVDATFPVVMPLVEGTYEVYLDVWVDAVLIAHYVATEPVIIEVAPDIDIEFIGWI